MHAGGCGGQKSRDTTDTPTSVSKAVCDPSGIFGRLTPTWFQWLTEWLTTAVMDIFVSSQFDDSELFLLLGDLAEVVKTWRDELVTTASFVAAARIAKLLSKSGMLGAVARFADDVDGIGSSRIRALPVVRTAKKNYIERVFEPIALKVDWSIEELNERNPFDVIQSNKRFFASRNYSISYLENLDYFYPKFYYTMIKQFRFSSNFRWNKKVFHSDWNMFVFRINIKLHNFI